jgi:hypothetical protein
MSQQVCRYKIEEKNLYRLCNFCEHSFLKDNPSYFAISVEEISWKFWQAGMIDEEGYYSPGKFQKDGWGGGEGESEILRKKIF